MAASIVINSATLAAGGKILTASMDGVTGDLSPTSGITGFKVWGDSYQYNLASVVASGTTVTITLDAPIISTAVVTVDLAASPTSNLTDGGSNTPTGQTGVSVTNNSSRSALSYNLDHANLKWIGRAPYYTGWSNMWQVDAQGEVIAFVATGTDCITRSGGWNNGIRIYVDGVLQPGPTLVSTEWGARIIITVFSGLSDTNHLVEIYKPYQMMFDGFIQVFGTLNAAGASDGYGPYKLMKDTEFLDIIRIGSLDNIEYGFGYVNPVSVGERLMPSGTKYNGQMFQFRARADRVRLWVQCTEYINVELFKDQVSMGEFAPTLINGEMGWLNLATGMEDGAYHTFTCNIRRGYCFDAVMISGPGAAFNTLSQVGNIAFFGDSIVEGSITGEAHNFPTKLALSLDKIKWNAGIAGAAVFRGDPSDCYTRYTDVTSITPEPESCIIQVGTNDVAIAEFPANPTASFTTHYIGMLNSLLSNTTAMKVYAMGILYRQSASMLVIDGWNNSVGGIQDCIASVKTAEPSYGSRLFYVDSSAWGLEDNNYLTYFVDGIHPNEAGADLIYNNLLLFLNPPSIGISPVVGDYANIQLLKLAVNTGGVMSGLVPHRYNILFEIAYNTSLTGGYPPLVGDRQHTLIYKIAKNFGGSLIPKIWDSEYTLWYKIANNLSAQRVDGSKYDLIASIVENTR